MNDFDFEELDKAVNSLATRSSEEHGNASNAPTKPPVESSIKGEPKSAPEIKSSVRPARLNSTPSNRRGSFMDIVPPAPRVGNTRVGPTLQPISKPENITTPKQPAETDNESTLVSADLEEAPRQGDVAQSNSLEKPKPESGNVAWPDPLDFHNADNNVEAQKTKENQPAPSPFLAEAKVEKRPLGAFSTFGQAMPEPQQVGEKRTEEPKPTVSGQDELMAEDNEVHSAPEPSRRDETEPAPVQEVAEARTNPTADGELSKPDMHNAAMMSIPQQYRTVQKPADKTTHSVFDTKEYHPPLLEAAIPEHHRGVGVWTKLFIALVVLVLLGVAGYFVYLFMFAQV